MGLCGWSEERQVLMRLHDLPALHLRRRPALPHDGSLQPQTEATSTGLALKEGVQALGTDVAEGGGLFMNIHALLDFLNLSAEFN